MIEVGDKVRVKAIDSVHHGKTGTVEDMYYDHLKVPKVRVQLDAGGVLQTFDEAGVERDEGWPRCEKCGDWQRMTSTRSNAYGMAPVLTCAEQAKCSSENEAFRNTYLARSKVCALLNAVPPKITLQQREVLLDVERKLRQVEDELEKSSG